MASRTCAFNRKDWTPRNEAEFNLLNSQKKPHCCVCSLLRSPSSHQRQQQQPTSSAVLLPEELFGSNRDINTSVLLRCTSCRVCVHAKCYGVSESTTAMNWLCRRCEQNVDVAKCCLCLQKGGALKATTDGRWAHVLCTLCFPGVYFGQPASRQPIVVDKMSKEKVVLLSCFYCSGRPDFGSVFYRGICLPCTGSSAGKRCGRAFHPTCGLVNGVQFTLGPDGQLAGSCCSSVQSRPVVKKKAPQHLSIGQQVYAKHPNGSYIIVSNF